MPNRRTTDEDLFRVALGPTKDCPPVEELEDLVSGAAPSPTELAGHVKSCPYCQTELQLLRTFHAGETSEMSDDARKASALLLKRSKQIVRQPVAEEPRVPWWKAAFTMRTMAQASLAMALILAVAGVVIHLRTTTQPPSLNEPSQTGEVLRSGSLTVISPAGDVQERPKEIRWEKIPNAVSYRVRLLEVDRNELWKAETTEDHIPFPAPIRSQIIPAKTLFLEINAYDSSGSKVGETGLVRFRLLQNDGG